MVIIGYIDNMKISIGDKFVDSDKNIWYVTHMKLDPSTDKLNKVIFVKADGSDCLIDDNPVDIPRYMIHFPKENNPYIKKALDFAKESN